MFNDELKFEASVINLLQKKGWTEVLKNKTEKELIDNWANILFNNNKEIDKLNGQPLTEGEKAQLLEKIKIDKTPFALNKLINGKTIAIKRDNPNDPLHYGKEVRLRIYDRDQIAGGKSCYQIVEQPRFTARSPLLNSRRGDLMLLINGMPVIHIELKKSNISVTQAVEQIKKYSYEGVFTGLFSLVQVFVAMTPEETLYFANPGDSSKFNDKFYFHWADFNNERYDSDKTKESWDKIIESLLSIPMAHKLIGFYTVPDDGDGVLKVLRSYQYYAVEAINNRVGKAQWTAKDKLGGYICHTTGSGKTLTSFKAAQLLASSGKADKVVFLVDRIELGNQSANEYKNFKSDNEEVQTTESTRDLIEKLTNNSPDNKLIVTSIQKMSNIKYDASINKFDIDRIAKKKIVFIVDECHRSTFGDMLADIKASFPTALYFGFTGTPIYEENQKFMNTTNTIFGNELHRYSIADGIRDNNVLGFDPYKILTFDDQEIRKQVALAESQSKDEDDAFSNPKKKKIYLDFMQNKKMAGYVSSDGTYVKGIEDYVPSSQYERDDSKDIKLQHQYKVVEHILKNWKTTSVDGKFHAIFATSSIKEACQYYQLFKDMMGKNGFPMLKIAGVFDETIGNNELAIPKEAALIEILTDYNKTFKTSYTIPTYKEYKKDVALRLSHKDRHLGIEKNPDKVLNLVIVVDQLLTGFDSKWINSLYLDKMLQFENIVQAFSRTNRIFGKDKPYGIIKYYRYPHTMERNIKDAFDLYSGKKPFGVFVDKLESNLLHSNNVFLQIKQIYADNGIYDFSRNMDSSSDKKKFSLLFSRLCSYLEAARIQGFLWEQNEYSFVHDNGTESHVVMEFDRTIFLILAKRYKELFFLQLDGDKKDEDVPFDIDSTAIEIDTDKIDSEYMDGKFKKYLKVIHDDEENRVLNELHRTFATLSQEDQKIADLILSDIRLGKLVVDESKSFRDYIDEYRENKKNDQIHRFAQLFGFDEDKVRELILLRPTEANIDEYGKFQELMDTLDEDKAQIYFESRDNKKYPKPMIRVKADNLARKFIILGGIEI